MPVSAGHRIQTPTVVQCITATTSVQTIRLRVNGATAAIETDCGKCADWKDDRASPNMRSVSP